MRTVLLLVALSCAVPAVAHAQLGFEAPEVKKDVIRVDGAITEWKTAQWGTLGHGNDASLKYSFAVGNGGLYIAADVRDERVVRTSEYGTREDAVVLTLVTRGSGGAYTGRDLWLYACVPGKAAGRGKVANIGGKPEEDRDVKVVEGPPIGNDRGNGYVMEAFVPWTVLGGGASRDSLRFSLRMRDVDAEASQAVESDLSVARVDKDALDALPELTVGGSGSSLLRDFIASAKPTEERPRFDLVANLFGSAPDERVVVVDRYVVVFGEGYRDGHSYDVMRLPVESPRDIEFANVAPLTGSKVQHIVVSYWQRDALGSRRIWSALAATGNGIRSVLAVETGKKMANGKIENTVSLRAQKSGPGQRIVQGGATASGVSAKTWQESPASDVHAVLLPWGPVSERTFEGTASGFAVTKEVPNENAVAADAAVTQPPSRPTVSTGTDTGPGRVERPTPEALIRLWKQRSGIDAREKPSFTLTANVAEDDRPELLSVYGNRLLVVGEGFRDGTAWFEFGIPVNKPDDVTGLEAHALTGNGRAQVVLRYKQHIQDVTRELLAVHCLQTDGFPRILAVEVARRRGADSVTNTVSYAPGGKAEALVVAPGKAKGWTGKSWPFAPTPEPGIASLLLPWSDKTTRYAFDGKALSPSH